MYPTAEPLYVDLFADCSNCQKPKRTPNCTSCKKPVLYCILCSLPVKGAATACLECGHGGHAVHLMQWFEV